MNNKNYLVTPKPHNLHEAFYADTLEITSNGFAGVNIMGDRFWCLDTSWCYEKLDVPEEGSTMENKEFQENYKPFVNGQWAYSIQEGWVKVSLYINPMVYPVEAGNDGFTIDGKCSPSDKHPSLFHTDIFNGTTPPDPEIDWDKVPRDTEVEVRDLDGSEWRVRFFSHRHENGRFYCFYKGMKSKACFNVVSWKQCRLINKSDIEKYLK